LLNSFSSQNDNASIGLGNYSLSSAQLSFWRNHGFLKIKGLLQFEGFAVESVSRWVDEISLWPGSAKDKWLLHYETSLVDILALFKFLCSLISLVVSDCQTHLDKSVALKTSSSFMTACRTFVLVQSST
jgi:hypothetical protein